MSVIKFLHAADLHLDSPFSGLPPERAAVRRGEQRALLDALVELCSDERCDLLLLAGDLFDAASARRESVEALARSLRGCRARVFIAPGNHDFDAPGSPYRGVWPEGVHIFHNKSPEPVVLEELNAAVWGAAFTAPAAPSLLEGFHVTEPGRLNLMVLHGDAENAASPYNPVSRAQIESSGLDYLALGHAHAASGPRRAGKTVYAWPGCAMGRGFDELGAKGVYLGTLSEAGCELSFRPLPGRRYEVLRVAAGDDPLEAVQSALPPRTEDDIYRICLTGPADPPDLRALADALASRFFSLSLRDETRPRRDLWAGAGDDTLEGLFLKKLREKRDEDPALYDLAAALGAAALEGREALEG